MEGIVKISKWVAANWADISSTIAYLIAGASIIVKITPTLKDDAWLKPVLRFLGKYISLNKTLKK